MKSLLIKIGIVAVLLLAIFLLYKRNRTLRDELNIKNVNVTALTSEIESLRTKNGELVVSNRQLFLTSSEFENLYKETSERLKSANIKIKNLQALTDLTVQGTIDTIVQVVYDTVNSKPTVSAGFHDKWYDVDVSLSDSVADFSVSCRHDITVVLQDMKYKCYWLFWKRPVEAKVNVIVSNANDTITKLQTISFLNKKRRK